MFFTSTIKPYTPYSIAAVRQNLIALTIKYAPQIWPAFCWHCHYASWKLSYLLTYLFAYLVLTYLETHVATHPFLAEQFGIEAEPVVRDVEEALQQNVRYIRTVICCRHTCIHIKGPWTPKAAFFIS